MRPLLSFCVLILLFFSCSAADALQKSSSTSSSSPPVDSSLYEALQWRCIGPFRGGRSCAVAGHPGDEDVFYFGSTGGGVWRSADGGRSWSNISDGFFGGSIGAIAVSEYDPNVIYVGGGEETLRGNVSSGRGVWKSEDAGKTWRHVGLENSRHIARIRIHPRNADWVYAAVIGDLFKDSDERGVYRSKDGGRHWERVLFVGPAVGAADLILDPNNPRIIYASTWRVRRTPYSFSSGGEGSGLWKSTDGGDSWQPLKEKTGLPKGIWGISGIAVSPANSERLWAQIEAKEGGLFRSDDAGEHWTKVNDERKMRQRAWYYSRVYADPKDEDVVYVLNVRWYKSKDGGRNFKTMGSPHGDHHDLWIDPQNPRRLIIADDGGAQVSYDGGENWTTYHNQPTAQFYRVTTDDVFPFRIYAAQQDNSSVRIYHRTSGGAITERDWEPSAGCECGYLAPDPKNPEIVYGGCYDGYLERKDHRRRMNRNVSVWPDLPMGYGAGALKYRFNWNFPILFSKHDYNRLYVASNHLHVSTDEGQSWQLFSPDLTRNDSTKLGPSGGPITKDNTSVEYYGTIFTVAESDLEPGVIWTGSDDGLIYITRDDGKHWENVTPPQMPEWIQVNSIEADPFHAGGLYVAATMYKSGDNRPYLYKTEDYGRSWKLIVNGIAGEDFTRVVRADPQREGLLYAGTEHGIYVSFDDGAHWQSLQLNLPEVPITDLAVKDNHLVAATQGRSLWVLDDLKLLQQLSPNTPTAQLLLFEPEAPYRMEGAQTAHGSLLNGTNEANGLRLYFHLPAWNEKDSLRLRFTDASGELIRSFSTHPEEGEGRIGDVHAGANYFLWDLRYPKAKDFPGMIFWWGSLQGPRVAPAEGFSAVLEYHPEQGEVQSREVVFKVRRDPRAPVSEAQIREQVAFAREILDKVSEAHEAILEMRDLREQLGNYRRRLKEREGMEDLLELAAQIDSSLLAMEQELYQTQNRSAQDPLNFPVKLTNKMAHLNAIMSADYPPTEQAIAVKNELTAQIDGVLAGFRQMKQGEIARFNQLMREREVDAIITK